MAFVQHVTKELCWKKPKLHFNHYNSPIMIIHQRYSVSLVPRWPKHVLDALDSNLLKRCIHPKAWFLSNIFKMNFVEEITSYIFHSISSITMINGKNCQFSCKMAQTRSQYPRQQSTEITYPNLNVDFTKYIQKELCWKLNDMYYNNLKFSIWKKNQRDWVNLALKRLINVLDSLDKILLKRRIYAKL